MASSCSQVRIDAASNPVLAAACALSNRFWRILVIHGDRGGKTPHDAALRHIAALRNAGKVDLFTAEGGGHFVLWTNTGCARPEVRNFVLGSQATTKCVSVASSD